MLCAAIIMPGGMVMGVRIIRGSVIGILLGVTCAIALANVMHISNKNKAAEDSLYASQVEDVVLRLHVKANSDSEEDLELKYEVRDAVLDSMREKLDGCESKEEAYQIISDNIPMIEAIAKRTIRDNGYSYPVNVYLTIDQFPSRQYGRMVIPAGNYDALRIDIGNGAGENFWCLLYPTLCYTVDTGAVVTSDGEEKIKRELDEESYEKLFVKHSVPKKNVKVKFKIVEIVKDLFD